MRVLLRHAFAALSAAGPYVGPGGGQKPEECVSWCDAQSAAGHWCDEVLTRGSCSLLTIPFSRSLIGACKDCDFCHQYQMDLNTKACTPLSTSDSIIFEAHGETNSGEALVRWADQLEESIMEVSVG